MNNNKKNILIVGGAGYIGGYMTTTFLNAGYDITVYDSLVYETRYLKDVNFVYGDVRDTNKLKQIVDDYDIIIWLAALVGDGACAINKDLTYSINYESVKWIVNNFKGKIIFTSTCSVYGLNNNYIDEDALPNPQSFYAESKLLAENYIKNNHDNYIIIRLGTLFGLGDRYSRVRLDLVVNLLTMKASHNEVINVFGGNQWRPLLHVKDVSEATLFTIKNNITGIYNLSYKNYKILDIANEISKVIPNTIKNKTDIKFEDIRNYKLKKTKISKLGFTKYRNLKVGINEIYNLFKKHRIKNPQDEVYSNASLISKRFNEKITELKYD